MQKILLYYPPTSENENKIMFNFPLPVLAACSLIDESKYDIRVECGLQKSMDVLIENNKDALCLGISIMTGTQIKLGLKLAERFRAVNTNVPIIWGGFHASSLVDETLRNRFVDIVVRSYGEIAFRDLVAALDMGKDVGVIKGISFKVNGRIKHNEDSEIPKMKDMPPVPYHLFDVAEFIRNDHSKSIPYVSSRGCPNRCGFCSEYVISRRKWNPRSSEQVVEDIVYLKEKYNPEAIRMVDSNFFANEKRVREICNGLVERNVGINLMKLNADAFFLSKYSDGTLQLMRSAGITNVLIGIESGYEPALKCIDKPATKDQAYNASLKLRINGISVGHSMMVGFPYDLPFSQMKQKHRTFVRSIVRFATHVQFDSQGRIQIPETLSKFANITKDVVFIGMIKKIEIWDPLELEKFETAKLNIDSEDFEDLANDINF